MQIRRIVGFSVAGIVGLVSVAAITIGVRQHQEGGALRAAMALSAEDEVWLENLPDVDPALRERAWAWMATWPTEAPRGSSALEHDWYFEGGEPPQDLVARHEAERAHMAELTAVLSAGGSTFSSLAWASTDLADSTYFGIKHHPHLLHCRAAVRWFGEEARLTGAPDAPLDDLDRFLASLAPAGGLIEVMVLTALHDMRDRMILRMIHHGDLAEDRVEGWLAESCRVQTWHLSGTRARRLLMWTPVAEAILRDPARAKRGLYGDETNASEELDFRWHARGDVARLIEQDRLWEAFIDGAGDPAAMDALQVELAEGGRTAQHATVGHVSMTWMIMSIRASHRLHRLAARAMRLGGDLPQSEPALVAALPGVDSLLPAGAFDLALRYERIAGNRVRVYVPKDTPLPPLLESAREVWIGGFRRAGTLVASRPIHWGQLEIDALIPR